MSLHVGVSTPWDLWDLSPADQRARLGAIADSGIDHVFTADHVSFFDGSGMDALVNLAAMSGIEPRLGLHAGVLLLALRHPMVAARQIAQLAQAAPGRLMVGVGVGGEDRHEFELCGVDPATRGERTNVSIELVRRLLEGGSVDGDGRFFDFKNGRIRPVPKHRVPFVIGGRSDHALRRTAAFGDGWLATWCSPKRFATGVETIDQLAVGRQARWQHGMQLWVGVGDTKAQARVQVSEAMEGFYKLSFSMFERYTPMGTPEDIAEFLAPYVEAGASVLNLTPCAGSPAEGAEAIAEVKRLLVSEISS